MAARKALLISDLHLGEATHFRKAGIPVPRNVSYHNWDMVFVIAKDRVASMK